jgi:hypothetical protein
MDAGLVLRDGQQVGVDRCQYEHDNPAFRVSGQDRRLGDTLRLASSRGRLRRSPKTQMSLVVVFVMDVAGVFLVNLCE